MEKYLFTNEQRALMESMQMPFAVYQLINKRVTTLILSAGFCKLFGYDDPAEAYRDMDNNMYKDTHPDDTARIADAALSFATEGGTYDVIYRTKRKGSSNYAVIHARGEHLVTDTGVQIANVWYTDEGDYDENAASGELGLNETLSNALHEQSILKASRYDYLTGLLSMTYFFELADSEKEIIIKNGGQPVLLYMDFNGMKYYNSKHGFMQGDKMLQEFSGILIRAFGSENCCRIGADHFAVISEEAGIEEKLEALFREFGELRDVKTPPVRVGIYPYRLEDVPVSTACDRARFARSAQICSYTSGFSYYNAELSEFAARKQYIIENIDNAIRERWIKVYYQPIVRSLNEEVCDEEALARWIDPERGIITPEQFIPALEEAGLVYKLDLYVLEQVLADIRTLESEGLYINPHSINLSRSDFDSCDIVEEIRRRVDDAGVPRDRITIEVTESIIGCDFDFMLEQISRFRDLGFPVWMDDFGSGYSTLDVLQSVRFDLIKFDMSFMKKLDEGENGKIILTELMKMAVAMGVDTICEGVETEAQMRFLQDIGCSKLQGFYFDKPRQFSDIVKWHRKHRNHGYENPAETEYYESIGRVNLYDLDVIAQGDSDSVLNTYDTLPIGIIEIKDDCTRFVRSNQSYRDFIKRSFGFELSALGTDFVKFDAPFLYNIVRTCGEVGLRTFFDEKMPDSSVVHSFARCIASNPVTGTFAVAIAVLSVSKPDDSMTYADIARALAADYYNIYVVDLDTDRYIEYSSGIGMEELTMERHGTDFFESAKRETITRIYEEDKQLFLSWFSKENIMMELKERGTFMSTYRLVDSGEPVYVNMKIAGMRTFGNKIIIGISIIDSYMKQKEHYEDLKKERDMMIRIFALSDGYMSLFTVDPETGHYIEYSSTEDFDSLGAAKEGYDFFEQAIIDARKYFHKDDQQTFIDRFTKENVMNEIRNNGSFSISYRLMINGEPRQVTLKAALFRDGDEEKMVVGIKLSYHPDRA